jgi:hypothetical protein
MIQLAALLSMLHHAPALASGPGSALAMAPAEPAPAPPQAPASTGSTELAEQGKFAADSGLDARTAEDATQAEIASGGLLGTGNARALMLTASGRVRVRRKAHQFSSAVAGNYGRAATDVYTPTETTVTNVQGMVRYDYFFARRWSAFLMTTARHDRFQGLDLRLNIDPGVAFHALTDPKHRLWFEAGYDFQFDLRRREARFADHDADPTTPEVQVADRSQVNHAARLFVGYANMLSERVTFDTGLEYLQSVLVGKRLRLNWVNALSVQLAGRLGLATTFTLRYENQPLPGIQRLDTITAILLTLRFV